MVSILPSTFSRSNVGPLENLSKSKIKDKSESVYVDTVPKCGTGLIKKILTLLNIDKGYKNEHGCRHLYDVFPAYSSGQKLNELFYSHRKYLILFRDPRDAVISQIFFEMRSDIAEKQGNSDKFKKYTLNQLIDISLNSENLVTGQLGQYAKRLFESFELLLELKKAPSPNRMLVCFEDLIPTFAGGAAPKRRFSVFKAICEFAGKDVSPSKIKNVMKECWGGTNTFRHDDIKKVGQWEKYFKPHHIKLFQEKYNDLLLGLGYETDPNWHLRYLDSKNENQSPVR